MKKIVFYSWQSDLPSGTNRSFIEATLKEAADQIKKDDEVDVEPVIDRDTKGVAGAPDIASTIFGKISTADIFVADISIVLNPRGKRATPNPNVLIELGYALKTLGAERIILVFNEAYGKLEQLPFDLKMRRVLVYSCPETLADKAMVRKELINDFKAALMVGMQYVPTVESRPDILDAIESNLPNKIPLLKRYLANFLTEIEKIQPKMFRDGGTAEDLVNAISATQPLIADFTKLSETVVVMSDLEIAQEIFKWFGKILEHYEPASNEAGKGSNADGDFFKFIGHEVFVSFINPFLRDEKWDILQTILSWEIKFENKKYRTVKKVSWAELSGFAPLLADESKRLGKKDLQADLLRDRHTTGGLAAVLPFKDFSQTDFYLSLYEKGPGNDDFDWRWYPRSYYWMEGTPMFMYEAIDYPTGIRIAHAVGARDLEEFKKRLSASQKFDNIHHRIINQSEIDRIGSRGGAKIIKLDE